MPVKKAARTNTRAKKTARGRKPNPLTSAIGVRATTMAVIVVLAGGIIVAARQQRAKERLDAARAEVVLAPDLATSRKPATSSAPVAAANVTADAPAATGMTGTLKPVTVTGCLERTDDGFRLKDTAGADAPRARSWKSGFLKKSSASLDVQDPSRALALGSHVGRRVSVTGTLADREMTARSLRRVGDCKAN